MFPSGSTILALTGLNDKKKWDLSINNRLINYFHENNRLVPIATRSYLSTIFTVVLVLADHFHDRTCGLFFYYASIRSLSLRHAFSGCFFDNTRLLSLGYQQTTCGRLLYLHSTVLVQMQMQYQL